MTKGLRFSKNKNLPEIQNLVAQQEHQSPQTVKIPDSILGVDYGEKFTGLAWAQWGTMVPLEIWPTQEHTFGDKIKALCDSKQVKFIVYGLPLGSDQSENHICQLIRKRAQETFEKTKIPFEFINERFSTQMTLTSDKKARRDDLSAMRILEFFISKITTEKDRKTSL